MPNFKIGDRFVGNGYPSYFIADISANHDGSLERAKMLIHLAADAGANAAKFQNFRADKIVSNRGFQSMGRGLSHQSKWKKPVFEVYKDASLPWNWTEPLKKECVKVGIDYFSTPYDLEAVDMLDPFVEVFKVGSGDITWPEILEKVSGKGKPVLLAAGASSLADVQRAVAIISGKNSALGLLQCNTNYTGSLENFKYIHLNVLKKFRDLFPHVVLGLSDHTPGHATVLGSITLGGRIVEKHFTDDVSREGPDHPFSMTPKTWREMVDRSRELEAALGSEDKEVAENERDTVIAQRRCIRFARDVENGTIITRAMLNMLRPAPVDSIAPYELSRVIGMRLKNTARAGEHLNWGTLEATNEV